MSFDFNEKTVVITGGSSGIGLALAWLLLAGAVAWWLWRAARAAT